MIFIKVYTKNLAALAGLIDSGESHKYYGRRYGYWKNLNFELPVQAVDDEETDGINTLQQLL